MRREPKRETKTETVRRFDPALCCHETVRRFDPALCCQHDWLRCHDAESGLTLELCTRDGCAAVCTRDASGAIEEFAADGFLECAGQANGHSVLARVGAQP